MEKSSESRSKNSTNKIVYALIGFALSLVIVALMIIVINSYRHTNQTDEQTPSLTQEQSNTENTSEPNEDGSDSQDQDADQNTPTSVDNVGDPTAPEVPSIALPNQ